MDLEKLDKSQIVLLTMLVSFVTSIATGIATVSLIEKAPSDVTRVIQRVVERTVETVAPAEKQKATVITREKTVIIKESDLIATAISEDKSKIVSVVDAVSGSFVSLGVFIDSKGTLAMDSSALTKDGKYAIDIGSDKKIPAKVIYNGGARGIALLGATADHVGVTKISTSESALKLGQTLVAFVGDGSISQGIITKLGDSGYIGTSMSGLNIAPGSILINLDGKVLGISTGVSRKVNKSSFSPILSAFAKATASSKNKTDGKTVKDNKSTKATSTIPEVKTNTK